MRGRELMMATGRDYMSYSPEKWLKSVWDTLPSYKYMRSEYRRSFVTTAGRMRGTAAKPTVSSQKRSRSNLLCCLLSVISQRPPRLFLSSSHMGSMPSCSGGSNHQYAFQNSFFFNYYHHYLFKKKKEKKKGCFQYDFTITRTIFLNSNKIPAEIP